MGGFQDLLQFIFAGITNGAIYALIALGFCVVHNTIGIVNFAQVDFVSLGGMFLFSGLFWSGLPMVVALPLAVGAVVAVGIAVERLGIRPSRSQNHLVLIFLTIGISIVLRGIMKLVWGKNRMAVPPLVDDIPFRIAGAAILPQAVAILMITALVIVLLVFFFHRTRLGLAMRAVASNQTAAMVVGIPVGRVKAASFALAGGLGGLAGVLITPITTLSYDVGVLLGLKGFAAAILGGFGSFPGAILGGVGLGLLESLSAGYWSSDYKDVAAFVVLLLVLFIRPKGLMGK
ncbi:branched-chain amino acid ABC transporter permease [Desulfosarcina ovata]|uniref:Branched-chain amino acid ABC transporter permease n=1 Tax=Desulfosarcina ovata subsp. ovata TaxID=2752305 RepID=A0A5K8ABY5_9BACT|nr:branched-chain amino acid ABC transporter permease [Desulfosarcina ovata]BBO90233.1 branched-chain amino acid ABC transporter permease [Desulfosarcina ovata subsp. ovata]